ncbi:HNH endonuclease [Gallibacter intestinalis]|uniref:HNH endonuclease n=1 Tax=Gallibacter intestinalis TaxID=2779356 RepID=A0ABR9QXT3_9FIRM|nr:HNH endonuclease [Gallibacter intestinalis]
MEAIIGRHLSKDECVHHIDKNRANNKKENLILMTKSEHMSFHAKERHQQRRNDLSIQ